jgi:MFS transporter, MCT family, aspergillic acid transporter
MPYLREAWQADGLGVTILGRWFQRNQALIIGISASGTSVGGVIFPLMIEHLLPRLGFAWTFRAVVLLITFLAAIANLTIRVPPKRPGSRPPPPPVKGMKARLAPFKDRKVVLTILGISLFASGYFVVLTFVVTVARSRGWGDAINAIVVLNGARFVFHRWGGHYS